MIHRLLYDLHKYFTAYAVEAFVVGILTCLIYFSFCFLYYLKKERQLLHVKIYFKEMIPRYIAAFLWGAYLYITCGIALFSRSEKYIDKIDLRLMGGGLHTFTNKIYFMENIFMFIPFGFFLVLCVRRARKPWSVFLFGFLGSLCIEATQLICKIGRFEIVDLWTNTLGALIGGIIGMVFIWIHRFMKRNRKEKDGNGNL